MLALALGTSRPLVKAADTPSGVVYARLRLSPKEKDELERRANEANVSINELLRRSTLGGEPLQSDVEKGAIRELSAIGNNLNQLTKAVHEGKLGGVEGLEETLKAIREKISEL